ncbi:hypothetical protein PR048_020393 [Dryococelus australis]|uniref:Uncharacterized protein n=1 Tax=Dryococelus australis TaxID=614101 RepID=A0ABQ9H658_9NEOP|nr:hypothetical protein PR048_020393 [Dryococelus australis]
MHKTTYMFPKLQEEVDRTLKAPAYLELFPAFKAEKRGSDKDETPIKCPIAAKRKALNWLPVFSLGYRGSQTWMSRGCMYREEAETSARQEPDTRGLGSQNVAVESRLFKTNFRERAAGMKGRGKQDIPEKTRRPAHSPPLYYDARATCDDVTTRYLFLSSLTAAKTTATSAKTPALADEVVSDLDEFQRLTMGGDVDRFPMFPSPPPPPSPSFTIGGHSGVEARALASHQGKPGSIPGRTAPRFSHAVIVPDDAAPFLPFLNSSAAPHQLRFTLFSQLPPLYSVAHPFPSDYTTMVSVLEFLNLTSTATSRQTGSNSIDDDSTGEKLLMYSAAMMILVNCDDDYSQLL